jgi:phosphoglycolate phosphatase-like HAD superfamily hydrolase
MGRTLANLREAGVKFWIATGDRSDPVKYLLIQSGEDVSSFIEYN